MRRCVYGIWCGHEKVNSKANNTRRNNKKANSKIDGLNFLDKNTLDWLNKALQKPRQDISLYFPYYKGFFYCIHCFIFFKANNNVHCVRCGKLLYKDTGDLCDLLKTYWNSERHLQIRKQIDNYLENKGVKNE
jgi:ribosomal protein S27E